MKIYKGSAQAQYAIKVRRRRKGKLHTATGVGDGDTTVASDEASLHGDPVVLACSHFPSLLKTFRRLGKLGIENWAGG